MNPYGYTPPPIPIVRATRRRQPRAWWIILYCCGLLIAASVFSIGLVATLKNGQSQRPQSAHAAIALDVTPTASSSPTDTPTSSPTDTPTPAPTQPPPTPTPTSAPSYHSCTASNCDNPWGFVLGCSCGNMWQPVAIAPPGFCSWFHCAPEFSSEQGDIGECGDGQFVHNGECGGHDGLLADLYVNVPPTATP